MLSVTSVADSEDEEEGSTLTSFLPNVFSVSLWREILVFFIRGQLFCWSLVQLLLGPHPPGIEFQRLRKGIARFGVAIVLVQAHAQP